MNGHEAALVGLLLHGRIRNCILMHWDSRFLTKREDKGFSLHFFLIGAGWLVIVHQHSNQATRA